MNKRADHITNKSQVNQVILQENSDDSIIYNRQNAITLRVHNKDLEKKIKLKFTKNSIVQNIMRHITENTDFEIQNEILTFQDLIYIFTKCRQEMINIYHVSKIHEH